MLKSCLGSIFQPGKIQFHLEKQQCLPEEKWDIFPPAQETSEQSIEDFTKSEGWLLLGDCYTLELCNCATLNFAISQWCYSCYNISNVTFATHQHCLTSLLQHCMVTLLLQVSLLLHDCYTSVPEQYTFHYMSIVQFTTRVLVPLHYISL